MASPAREKLCQNLEFLADKYRQDCPHAASVLRCVAGAMELGIDRPLADVTLGWMVAECELMGDELIEAAQQATGLTITVVDADPAPAYIRVTRPSLN